jgi:[ribosomal protein S5]-alanine N-acetyltransferase
MARFSLTTDRLAIEPLTINDSNFILELVNTEGWLRFIGDRNIRSETDAVAYIQRILQNSNIAYWVVRLKDGEEKIGIVTYIKRDYLEHHDIGFAFLPSFSKKGYAYEATASVLGKLILEEDLTNILATTIPENISSIRLLERMGLAFKEEIEVQNDKLHVYGAPVQSLQLSTSR